MNSELKQEADATNEQIDSEESNYDINVKKRNAKS